MRRLVVWSQLGLCLYAVAFATLHCRAHWWPVACASMGVFLWMFLEYSAHVWLALRGRPGWFQAPSALTLALSTPLVVLVLGAALSISPGMLSGAAGGFIGYALYESARSRRGVEAAAGDPVDA
jgi:hypothetical protein